MAIGKVEMFTVICDNCKTSADDGTDYSCWNDENRARDAASEAGFIQEDGKDYCAECYHYDDNDKLEINFTRMFHEKKL